jgi:hypothetical protein
MGTKDILLVNPNPRVYEFVPLHRPVLLKASSK